MTGHKRYCVIFFNTYVRKIFCSACFILTRYYCRSHECAELIGHEVPYVEILGLLGDTQHTPYAHQQLFIYLFYLFIYSNTFHQSDRQEPLDIGIVQFNYTLCINAHVINTIVQELL
jgi:hypothetical protein